VLYADRVTAPSPSYARELQTEELGCGLHGLFAALGAKLHGVLPGLDTSAWNPATDHRLAERYTAENASAGKEACKRALQAQLGLASRGSVALCAMLGPLDAPRGISLVLRAAPQLLEQKIQLAFLGRPAPDVEGALRDLAAAHPQSVVVAPALAADELHRVLAGADAILLPTRHEPGGLLQLKALRYGAVPVVHAAGGLRDTVVDFDGPTLSGSGICFSTYTEEGLVQAVHRVATLRADGKLWPALVRNAMQQSYTWEQAARRYIELYSS
jgi:starch synthase